KVYAIVPTHDLAAARTFYEDKVGAKVSREVEDGSGVLYVCGEGSEFLLYQTQVRIPAEHTTMFFRVPDIDGAVADLESRGIEFLEYDMADYGFEGSGKTKVFTSEGYAGAFFNDPEGNIIGVTQMDA
ncbi:MAG TPA: VOC family protein, partial [Pseudomonadales bacterium]|nr:VOC family protein [Pseudomonadales bacterium]